MQSQPTKREQIRKTNRISRKLISKINYCICKEFLELSVHENPFKIHLWKIKLNVNLAGFCRYQWLLSWVFIVFLLFKLMEFSSFFECVFWWVFLLSDDEWAGWVVLLDFRVFVKIFCSWFLRGKFKLHRLRGQKTRNPEKSS